MNQKDIATTITTIVTIFLIGMFGYATWSCQPLVLRVDIDNLEDRVEQLEWE